MAVRRRPPGRSDTPVEGVEGDAAVLLHWHRWQRVPPQYLDHDDLDVRHLASVTEQVVHRLNFIAFNEGDWSADIRESEQATLRMSYGRLNHARRRLARRLGLDWTAVYPGGRIVRHPAEGR